MSAAILNEELIRLSTASKYVPGHPHVSTLQRWAQRRSRPLETVRVGGRRYTSKEAIHRFIQHCTNPGVQDSEALADLRLRELAAVDEHLRREGVL